jgi:peptide/nickel transport system substrate-binding protein
MADQAYSRRAFLKYAGYGYALISGGALALAACTPDSTDPAKRNELGQSDIGGAELITDRSQFPKTFKESPDFAAQVAAGKLPPVAQRIGEDPLVLKPLQSIGKYGGTIRRGFLGQSDVQNANRFCAGPDNLLYFDYQFQKVIGNIAKDYELSADNKVLTLHLRRGMRWSDGAPFTADDILFWRYDINLHPDLGGAGSAVLRIGGKNVEIEKVDDFTVRYISAVPNPLLPRLMAGWTDIAGMSMNGQRGGGGFAPKHYLSKFHPKYSSAAEVSAQAVAARFDGWVPYFLNQVTWSKNPDLPVLSPWRVTQPINKPPWELSANPYSIWVDTEGHQLPYIQTISMSNSESLEVINLRTVAGEFDFQDRHLTVQSLPVLLENQERSHYKIHKSPSTSTDFGVLINLAYDEDKTLGDLLRTTDFRRALALGIKRDQVNEAFFLGTSAPSAVMPADFSPYFPGPEWKTKWATHDPAQANRMLDGIGLSAKDSDGYRMRPDGKGRIRLDYQALKGFADFPAIGEMIKQHWKEIGIDLNVQAIEANLLVQRIVANKVMLSGHQVGTDEPFVNPDGFVPTSTNTLAGLIGIPYAKWFASGGKSGVEPPESVKQLKEAMQMYRDGLQASDEERNRLGKELFKLHADQVWSIGVVGFGLVVYGLFAANEKLRNVPSRVINTQQVKTPTNAFPMTFYYE